MKYISIFSRSLHQKILELESKLEDSKGTVTPRLAGSREELELKLSGNFLHFVFEIVRSILFKVYRECLTLM